MLGVINPKCHSRLCSFSFFGLLTCFHFAVLNGQYFP